MTESRIVERMMRCGVEFRNGGDVRNIAIQSLVADDKKYAHEHQLYAESIQRLKEAKNG